MRISLVLIILWIALFAARAEEPKTLTLTNQDVAGLITAFRALDGHPVTIKEGETNRSVIEPYKFGSKVRATLGKNLVAVLRAYEPTQAALRQILLELSNGTGIVDPDSCPLAEKTACELKQAKLNIQSTKLALEKVKVPIIFIARLDLKLDVNEIAPSTLAQLDPILQD